MKIENLISEQSSIQLTALDLVELGKLGTRAGTSPQMTGLGLDTYALRTFGTTCQVQSRKLKDWNKLGELKRSSSGFYNPALQQGFVDALEEALESVADGSLILADGLDSLRGTKPRTCTLGVAAQTCATAASAIAYAIEARGLVVPQIIRDAQFWLRSWAASNRHLIARHLRADDPADLRSIAQLRSKLCCVVDPSDHPIRQVTSVVSAERRFDFVRQGTNRLQLDRTAQKLGVTIRAVSGTGESIYSHPKLDRTVRLNVRRKDATRALVVFFRKVQRLGSHSNKWQQNDMPRSEVSF